MASITLRNIAKQFGVVEVIRNISLDVADGEFVVLVGPSGCGKSTLLRMIAGLEPISRGDLEIGGRRVNGLSSKDRDIAMVFQNYALYPHMTVEQNMGFSLKLRGVPKSEIETRVRRAAQILSLDDYLERLPRNLSGGQRQRVAMGRAIVRDPAVFLFDEPLSNLDAKLRVSMRTEIKELHQRLGITTVYVTHDQVEAMSMADRIVVMHGGDIEQIGTPMELYDRPDNVFVAGFIGSPAMNLIEGTVEFSDIGTRFHMTGGHVLDLPDDVPPSLAGRHLVLGVRPEDVRLAGGTGRNGMKARVSVVEPMGSETHISMKIGDHEVLGAFRERSLPTPGAQIAIELDAAKLHWFDRSTERRILQ